MRSGRVPRAQSAKAAASRATSTGTCERCASRSAWLPSCHGPRPRRPSAPTTISLARDPAGELEHDLVGRAVLQVDLDLGAEPGCVLRHRTQAAFGPAELRAAQLDLLGRAAGLERVHEVQRLVGARRDPRGDLDRSR